MLDHRDSSLSPAYLSPANKSLPVGPRIEARRSIVESNPPEELEALSDEAICAGLTDVFFGPMSERPERRVEREAMAKAFCAMCPVRVACREAGRNGFEHGIWGGETEEERAAAGYMPRSPSRRSVLGAAKGARTSHEPEHV